MAVGFCPVGFCPSGVLSVPCHRPTLWPSSSVVRLLAQSARGSGLVHVLFSSTVTFGGSVWVLGQATSSKGTVSLIKTLTHPKIILLPYQ